MYYTENYKIYSFNCDESSYASIESLFQYMIETSISQTEIVMKDNHEYDDYFWVINQWDVDIIKRPRKNDEIIVDTISSGARKFYAYRNFTIYDEEGNIYVKAKSRWLLLDKKTKAPVRVPEELINIYGIDKTLDHIKKDFKYKKDLEYSVEYDFTVGRSDIDTNKHVNNAKYLNWIIETTPINREIKRIKLIYKKELMYRDKIISKSSNIIVEDNNKVVYNVIEDKHGNIKTLSKIYLGERNEKNI